MKETYDVKGMTCASCVSHVEKAAKSVPGVTGASANLLTNQVTVEGTFDEGAVRGAVKKAGYMIAENTPDEDSDAKRAAPSDETAPMKRRLIISFVFLALLMYLSMGHMLGLPLPAFFHGAANAAVYILTQALLTLPILYVNRSYFERGYSALFHRAPNMDSLIAIGSSAAVVYGFFALYAVCYGLGHGDGALVEQYRMDLYFESAGMIVTLITLGKYFETRSRKKTGAAIEKLVRLAPDTAEVIRDGAEVSVPLNQVRVGDRVVVRPGQRVPVDGVIESGESAFDESALTGESVPVDKGAGARVMAASVCQTGSVVFIADKVGKDTTLSQIIRLVEEAAATKAPIARLADKISGVFVPVVILIALVTGGIWLLAGSTFAFALTRLIAVLVISCPCALGLATPVAIMVGTGKGAQMGVLLKSGEAIEALSGITTVVLDKTGTLTTGAPVVTDVIPFSGRLLPVARALETGSEHPFAKAIMEGTKNITPEKIEAFRAVPGRGVEGVTADQKRALGGNLQFMRENDVDTQAFERENGALADSGKTPLYFALDGAPLGMIACADVLKEDSAAAVQAFHALHRRVVMLTGDNERTARAIAKTAGIDDVRADVLPADKELVVRQLQEKGERVAMIGDGINDAPALMRADVGLAIGAGQDVAIDAADVVLMRGSLNDAVTALRLSRATLRTIKAGLFWAFFYNVIGIPVAAGALYPAFGISLSPMLAAAAMSLSSVCVVLNALSLNRFKAIDEPVKKQEAQKKKDPQTTVTLVMPVGGMSCEHCKAAVENALKSVPGVLDAQVSLEQRKAVITAAPEANREAMLSAVREEDYEPGEIKPL